MEVRNEHEDHRDFINKSNFDQIRLKEERKLRNKQKKIANNLQKQKEREEKELLLKLQLKSNKLTVITRDLVDKTIGNTLATVERNIVNETDFPELGSRPNVPINLLKSGSSGITTVEPDTDKRRISKIELSDFLYVPTFSKQSQPRSIVENYNGNPLDSDMPTRKKGKYKDEPKTKKLSKLKREIIKDKNECVEHEFKKNFVGDTYLCDNAITPELNDLVTTFISVLVGLQEKLYKRDSIRGKYKRRYVVGLHEVKKYLNLNKIKILIVAPDINLIKDNGALNCAVKEIFDLAKTNNTPYLFALKRRTLGTLTLKHIPVSCLAVLNYEGLEDHYNNIFKFLPSVKKDSNEKTKTEDEANQKFLNSLMEALKCRN